jgi:hypothetical protein
LLALEAGDEHLLGPLCRTKVVLQDAAEELDQFLVTLRLGVLDVALQGLDVVGGVVEYSNIRL